MSSGAGGRCRDANNASSGIHAPDASSGNALRFQPVKSSAISAFSYLRDRASCFCFLDDAVKGRGINTRHRNFTLQCDFRNRKTGIHFIQRHIGGGINRCWRKSRFPSINESAIVRNMRHALPISSSGLVPFAFKRVLNPYGCWFSTTRWILFPSAFDIAFPVCLTFFLWIVIVALLWA